MCVKWKYCWRCHGGVFPMPSFIHFNAGLKLMIYFNCICKLDSIKQASISVCNMFQWHSMLACNFSKSCTNDRHIARCIISIDDFKCIQVEMVTVMSSAISAFQLSNAFKMSHTNTSTSNNVLSTICLYSIVTALCLCTRHIRIEIDFEGQFYHLVWVS